MTLTEPYYISKKIKYQLLSSKKAVIQGDQDRVFLITGNEGSGKSVLAMQLAYHLDNTLSIDDVCFNADDFAKRLRECEKYKSIIFDEAFIGLSSRGFFSKENLKLISLLQECRQKNLFIFIALPSFFLLEKYVALFRSHALFHTAIYKKNFKNRYYKAYNKNNKKLLYIKGKKLMSYSQPHVAHAHRFYGKYPPTISEETYKAKKLKSFATREDQPKKEMTLKELRPIYMNLIGNNEKMKKKISNRQLGHLFSISDVTVGNIKRELLAEST